LAAVQGMKSLLRGRERLSMISEFWTFGLERSGGSAADYLHLLIELGFRLSWMDDRTKRLMFAVPDELLRTYPPQEDTYTNLFCTKGGTIRDASSILNGYRLTDPVPRWLHVAQEPCTQWSNPVTFGLIGPGFGDVWKSVQFAHYVRRTQKIAVRLYARWHGWPGEDFSARPLVDRVELAREIEEVLDVSTPLEIVTGIPLEEVTCLLGRWPMHFPQVPTRVRWRGWAHGLHRRLAYQLDGRWAAGDKNPPPEDVQRLLGWAPGFELVRFGEPLSVRECVEAAAESDLFFGVDSGMLQLCYAVGVPVFLIGYRMSHLVLFAWHGDRHAVHCTDTADFLAKARLFLGLFDEPIC